MNLEEVALDDTPSLAIKKSYHDLCAERTVLRAQMQQIDLWLRENKKPKSGQYPARIERAKAAQREVKLDERAKIQARLADVKIELQMRHEEAADAAPVEFRFRPSPHKMTPIELAAAIRAQQNLVSAIKAMEKDEVEYLKELQRQSERVGFVPLESSMEAEFDALIDERAALESSEKE